MRSTSQLAYLIAVGLTLLSSSVANTQDVPASEPWNSEPKSRPAAPDVYLLPDESGKLRQILGFRYEDFLQAWNNQEAAGDAAPPRYVIDSFSVSGESEETKANLSIQVQLTIRGEGWIGVPLKMPDLIVRQVEIVEQNEGECFVFDTTRQGHVAWLHGKAGQKRRIVLSGLTKLNSIGGKKALEFFPPYATVSEFELTLPEPDVEFDASAGVESTTIVEDNKTRILLQGSASPLRLAWRRRQVSGPTKAITLESRGEMTVKIDQRQAVYSAKLQLDSFGSALEVVRVRIPRAIRSAKVEAPPELQALVRETEIDNNRVLEIRPQRPTTDAWILEISAEQPMAETAEGLYEIMGFEVLDAVRQSGQVVLQVNEKLQAYFDLEGDLEQVPLEDSTRDSAIAAFSYSGLPWKLSVHTQPQRRRVNVQPNYLLHLDPDEARIEAEFDYQFSGANTFAVRVDLRGWQLTDDPLESGGVVDANRFVVTKQGVLVLPLVSPDVQRARISLELRKPLEMGRMTFPLPEAMGGFVLPGQLIVRADPSLQVSTDLSNLEGMGAVDSVEQLAPGADAPLTFRTFLSRATLGAEVSRRQRQVTVAIDAAVDIDEEKLVVRQQLDYRVKYRPMSQVPLFLPESLSENPSLKVLVEERQVPLEPSVPGLAGMPNPVVITLPRPMPLEFRVEIQYEIEYPGATLDEPAQISLPLVSPNDPVQTHSVAVQAKPPLRAGLSQGSDAQGWTLSPQVRSPREPASVLQLVGSGAVSSLPLLVRVQSLDDFQNATLERAWLQTWIAGNLQQDRAVFLFHTSHSHVYVELPPEAATGPLEVVLDGALVQPEPPVEGRLTVALSDRSPRTRHVLELRYQRSATLTSSRTFTTRLAKLVCGPMNAPVFWQFVLPQGWHVARGPETMTSESWLGWKDFRWGRQPTRTQGDLENLCGATSAPPPPPTVNQYLYSAFAIPESIDVVVARQTWLVVVGTLVAFGIGLLCVYTRIVSLVSFWLALALVMLALLLVYPEITLLAGQALFWGGAMILATMVLRRAFTVETGAGFSLTTSAASSRPPSTSATESWIEKQRPSPVLADPPTVTTESSGSEI